MRRSLDLFSGIGGFALGLERTGSFRTAAFCEIDPFAKQVLTKHWPEVPIYADVRQLTRNQLQADGLLPIDAIVGGFPCQDVSDLGSKAGVDRGRKSGLWKELARVIGEIRPSFVVIENVAALRKRGLDTVIKDLASIRYDAEWAIISASAIGAPHRRERLWIVAYPSGVRTAGTILEAIERLSDPAGPVGEALRRHWDREPNVPRISYGIPNWSHRNRCLGNAVVPAVVELIGRSIIAAVQAEDVTYNNIR